MISKIKIPKEALKFLLDKTTDFLVSRLSKKVDEKEEKSIQLSTDIYERELRKDLENLKDSVQNLEAVIYQGKRLYEMSLCELNNRFVRPYPTNINIYGDVSVTVNLCYIEEGIQINGQKISISKQDIVDVLNFEASKLFEATENNSAINKNKITTGKFSSIISKRSNELIDKRNED